MAGYSFAKSLAPVCLQIVSGLHALYGFQPRGWGGRGEEERFRHNVSIKRARTQAA